MRKVIGHYESSFGKMVYDISDNNDHIVVENITKIDTTESSDSKKVYIIIFRLKNGGKAKWFFKHRTIRNETYRQLMNVNTHLV